ncbi:unnamed protein product [Boreogadus saida]
MGAAILNSVSEFRSVTTEFNRDGEIAVRGKGACLCVSLGNVLGPPRRMDIKTHQELIEPFPRAEDYNTLLVANFENERGRELAY